MATATEITMLPKQTGIAYTPSEQQITDWAKEFFPLVITDLNDKAMVKRVHDARMIVRDARITIEKTRVALKAEALEYGRRVDSEAKRHSQRVEEIERHLTAQEGKVEAEKARVKKEKEDAARAVLQKRVALLAAVSLHGICHLPPSQVETMTEQQFQDTLGDATDEFNAAQAAIAEKERAAKAEAERLAKEKADLDRQRAEQEAEKKRLADEQAKLDAEKKRIADEEAAKDRVAENERIAKEAAERARIETEERMKREAAEAKAKAEREAAEVKERQEREAAEAKARAEAEEAAAKAKTEAEEAARLKAEAMRPDKEKLLAFADYVAAIELPKLSVELNEFTERISRLVTNAAEGIRAIAGQM